MNTVLIEHEKNSEEYLAADIKLYNYFTQKFNKKLKLFGINRMIEERAKLDAQNEQMKVLYIILGKYKKKSTHRLYGRN